MNLFVLCYHTIYTTYIYIYMNVFENKEIVENQNKHESWLVRKDGYKDLFAGKTKKGYKVLLNNFFLNKRIFLSYEQI